jgi:hypothetical protein
MSNRLTGVKQYGTAIYPVHAAQTSGLLQRSEPILTPEQLVSRFLKGIPLVMPNGDSFSPDELKDRIYLATNSSEILLGTVIFTEIFKEKLPFDYALYKSYINLNATKTPIQSLAYLAIVSADGNNLFEIPPTWIETTNFSKGIINVIPLLAAYGVNQVSGAVGNAGIAFLTVLDGLNWVPAYWEIGYTAGLSNTEGQVPSLVNELVGCVAAIDILSEIAPNFIWTSQSQSQDGISQASSGPGPRIYMLRIEDLMRKRDEIIKKLKAIFSTRYFVSNF